jgi:hypothetical protein
MTQITQFFKSQYLFQKNALYSFQIFYITISTMHGMNSVKFNSNFLYLAIFNNAFNSTTPHLMCGSK